jgi:magnesium transporter
MLEEEDKENLQELLQFDEESAGGIMVGEFVAVPEGVTVGEAIEKLREMAEDVEQVHNVYAVDRRGRLTGILELWRLTISDDRQPVAPLIDRDLHSVPVDMDQEEVAALAKRYDLVEIPVVDVENRLVGRVTIDDLLDVLEEEVTEDISRMAGTGEEDFHEDSVMRITWLRFPWLLIGMAGGIGSALLMSRFAVQLEKVIALAFFVPVIMAMGGSVGIQCSTVVVRSLAIGELEAYRMGRRLLREFLVAFLNAIFLAAILSTVALLWHGDPRLGLVIGLAMFITILLAAASGTLVPMMLKRFGFDPALATGPFITTTNDMINLLIYFAVATLLLAEG